jgi:hypothetical protein
MFNFGHLLHHSNPQQRKTNLEALALILSILQSIESLQPEVQGIAALVQKVAGGGTITPSDLTALQTIAGNLNTAVEQLEATAEGEAPAQVQAQEIPPRQMPPAAETETVDLSNVQAEGSPQASAPSGTGTLSSAGPAAT